MFSPYHKSGKVSGVRPLVITGNRLTGQGSDSTLQGFHKYNNHDHWIANPSDFRFYNINVGDEVYLYDLEGNNVIGDVLPATINFISGHRLRITVSATRGVVNGTLLLKYDKSVYIQGVNIDVGSNLLYFYSPVENVEGLPGFISPEIAHASLSWTVQGNFVNPTQGVYRIMSQLPEASWLVGASVQSQGDVDPHCTVQFIINVTGNDTDYGERLTASNTASSIVFVPETISSTDLDYPIKFGSAALPRTTSIALRVSDVNPTIVQAYGSNTLNYTLKFHKLITNTQPLMGL